MVQLNRQIGVVLGLTIILTFPVTVVSGAGSHRHAETIRDFSGVGWNVRVQLERTAIAGVDAESRDRRRGENVQR
jgi:hypothetical protein